MKSYKREIIFFWKFFFRSKNVKKRDFWAKNHNEKWVQNRSFGKNSVTYLSDTLQSRYNSFLAHSSALFVPLLRFGLAKLYEFGILEFSIIGTIKNGEYYSILKLQGPWGIDLWHFWKKEHNIFLPRSRFFSMGIVTCRSYDMVGWGFLGPALSKILR